MPLVAHSIVKLGQQFALHQARKGLLQYFHGHLNFLLLWTTKVQHVAQGVPFATSAIHHVCKEGEKVEETTEEHPYFVHLHFRSIYVRHFLKLAVRVVLGVNSFKHNFQQYKGTATRPYLR